MRFPPTATATLLAAVLLAAGGCSNFDRAWNAAGSKKPVGIDGRWQGAWKSEQDGHTGALLCVITQTGDTTFEASFNATYGGIFHFTYDAKLTGSRQGDRVRLTGDQDLGWPVGVFHYEGAATPEQMFVTYRASADHGSFALARPGGTRPTGPLAP